MLAACLLANTIGLTPTANPAHALGRRAVLGTATAAAAWSSVGIANAEQCVGRCEADFKAVATQTGVDPTSGVDDFVRVGTAGLRYKDMRMGTGGQQVALGDTISIQFSGRCLNLNGEPMNMNETVTRMDTMRNDTRCACDLAMKQPSWQTHTKCTFARHAAPWCRQEVHLDAGCPSAGHWAGD